jgi:hypothetical protein
LDGHEAIKCHFEQNGIDYSGYKNSIVDLDKETRKEVKKQNIASEFRIF